MKKKKIDKKGDCCHKRNIIGFHYDLKNEPYINVFGVKGVRRLSG